ncbi:MAG: hypothetical protein CMN30_07935 [Sandaracinus sp.]|nr:hypothetical protein [Sandaracinus sp.]|tara:strand:+ start:3183 stop:5093 length:1911 start_codon:yes stop_codon:yes gene_type:complete
MSEKSEPFSIHWQSFTLHAVELLAVLDPQGVFRWVNERWEDALGWPPAELVGRQYGELTSPIDLDESNRQFQRLLTGERVAGILHRFQTFDGDWRWIEWNASLGEDGLVYAHASDRTDEQKRIHELAASVEFLRMAEEMSDVGHWRVDLVDGTVFWSPQVYRIHGVDPEAYEPNLETAIDAYHPDDREIVQGHVARSVERREPFDFELRIVRPNGDVRQVHSVGTPQVDRDGEVAGIFGVFRDITKQHELRQRLAQSEKMASIGTLAAGVAHEINNPLSYIQANAHQLAEEFSHLAGVSPSARLREMAEMIDDIRSGTERIGKIVKGLKAFSRSSEARVEIVELPRVVDVAIRLCATELRHKARLTVEADPATPLVRADESQLAQVVINLVVNAAHAFPDGTVDSNEVIIRTGRDTDRAFAFLEVRDNGSGMSEEILSKAFAPFFTTKPQGIGTGLGLSISHGIVRSFGGDIEARSKVGKGTVMRIILPVARGSGVGPADARRTSVAPQRESTPGANIVVIDDDPLVGRSIVRILRDWKAKHETDPRAVLQRIRGGEHFDVILCDLMMPTMSGREFCEALEAHDPTMLERVILVTGGAISIESEQFLARTSVEVIHKPLMPAVVQKAVVQRLDPSA